MERILVFGCHPDDIEFSAAGTLALLAGRTCEIHLATMAITMKEGSARDGRRIGRPMGECFLQHRGLGHPADNILKNILGDLCMELPE